MDLSHIMFGKEDLEGIQFRLYEDIRKQLEQVGEADWL